MNRFGAGFRVLHKEVNDTHMPGKTVSPRSSPPRGHPLAPAPSSHPRAPLFADVCVQLSTALALTLGSLRDFRNGSHGPLPDAATAELERAERNAARAQALVDQFLDLAGLADGSEQNPESTTPPSTPDQRTILDLILAAIDKNLGDEDFTIERLASEVAVSRAQLYRRLEALTGLRPAMLLMQRRLDRSAELIAAGDSVSQVAYAVGFKTVSHFSQRFRERYGTTPSRFRATQAARNLAGNREPATDVILGVNMTGEELVASETLNRNDAEARL